MQFRKDFAKYDNLRSEIGFRFQQDRVHIHVRKKSTSLRLKRLSPSNLSAFGRNERIQRHILRFKRRNLYSGPMEHTANPGRDQTLPDI
jgi:hypothetical protein